MTAPDRSSLQAPLSATSGRELALVFVTGAIALAVVVAMGRYGVLPELAFGFLAYGALLGVVWAVVVRAPGRRWRDIGLRRCEPMLLIIGGFAALIWIGISTAIFSAAGLWEAALAAGGDLIDPFRERPAMLAALFVLAVPVAALAEEIIYRGLLYGWLRQRMGVAAATLTSAFVFTFSHIYVFNAGIPFIVEMLALSMLLALLFEYSRSLWPGILCHGLNNFALMVAYSLN
jgi:membrane protease YdiL (CAAX protease family)